MYRRFIWAALAVTCALLCLSGCAATPPEPEYDSHTTPFDMARAEEVLRATEQCVIDLVAAGGGDAQESLRAFQDAYGTLPASAGDTEHLQPEDVRLSEGWQVWRTFFDNPPPDATGFLPIVQERLFFPTVFHVGIELTEASIVKTVYRDPARQDENTEYLCVREEYTGSDPLLRGFRYRESYYVRAGDGWRFHHFDGDVNTSGGGTTSSPTSLNFNYLPLKPAH